MNDKINNEEQLLRAVYPENRRPDFWVNGRLSSAALKDPRGLSVNRTGERSAEEAVEDMKKNFRGSIVSITMNMCNAVKAYVLYCPSKSNPYHCEIHGSRSEILLSEIQARRLAENAQILYFPVIYAG